MKFDSFLSHKKVNKLIALFVKVESLHTGKFFMFFLSSADFFFQN